MAELSAEKTQDATPYRRQQAREQGHVAQSQELVSAALLLAGLALLIFAGGSLLEFLMRLLAGQLGGGVWLNVDADFITAQWGLLVRGLATVLLPIVGLLLLFVVGLHLLQTGFLFLPSRAMPDFSRVSPLAGLSRLFSLSSLMRLGLGIVKTAVVAAVAWQSWHSRRDEVLNLAKLELPEVASFVWQFCLWTCFKIGAALVVLAVVDYLYQRWKFERDLRMTPQEVRDEQRNLEGDPLVAGRRRQISQTSAVSQVR